MKRLSFLITCAVLIVFSGSHPLLAQTPTAPDEKPGQAKKRSGLFTMYVNDPLSRTLCFGDGKEGMAFEKFSWGNRCSDLSYNLAGNGTFVAGIEVNRIASIVDLGTPNELRSKYGYEDANEGGEGFASLHLEGDKIVVLKDNSPQDTYQPVQEAAKLFTDVVPSATAPIKLGHIYLVRIADKKDKSFQQIVKLMVIAYRPDEAVTLRWYLL